MAVDPRGTTVCVVGAGVMGGQIAHQIALWGYPVRMCSRSQQRLNQAMEECGAILQKRVERGKLAASDLEAALARLDCTTDIAAASADAEILIESVAEERNVKSQVLTKLGRTVSETAIIATNSSTMPSSFFATAVPHPQRLLNLHFMNPALAMPLVEVIPGEHTSNETVLSAVQFIESIGKSPVQLAHETFGFVANRICFSAMQEAFRLVEEGIVTVADCDKAVREGLGWPMGPFEIADLVGLDVVEAILLEGHRQTGESRWQPPRLLREKVVSGELGTKSGKGFTTGDH